MLSIFKIFIEKVCHKSEFSFNFVNKQKVIFPIFDQKQNQIFFLVKFYYRKTIMNSKKINEF